MSASGALPPQIEGTFEETELALAHPLKSETDEAKGGMGPGNLLSSDWTVTPEASLTCC